MTFSRVLRRGRLCPHGLELRIHGGAEEKRATDDSNAHSAKATTPASGP